MNQNINVDLIPKFAVYGNLYFSQYDVGREAIINLVNGSTEYEIPSGATVTLVATKPSGLGFTQNCTFEGNQITVVCTAEMTDEAGKFPCEIRIANGSLLLGTANFTFNVERSPHPEGTTDGTADSVISQITVALNNALSDIEDAKEEAIEEISQSGGGSGLTADIKTALLQIAQKVAYIDEHGQDYYDDLYDALYSVAVVRIGAVYTQTQVVYPTTALDDLKTDLVVTAYYEDSTSAVVTNYTVSGTLAVGTSTVTVTYKEFTTTFNVTVSTAPIAPYYELPEAVTFTGSNVFKTGVKLNSLIADGAASMFIDFSDTGATGVSDGRVAWNIGTYASSNTGVHISGGSSNGFYNFIPITAQNTSAYNINATFGSSCNVKMMFVWELVQSVYYWTVYAVVNGVFEGKYSGSLSSFSVGADSPLVLGGQTTNSDVSTFNNYWKGTVNALKVYDSVMSESDIFAMLGIPSTVSYELPSETTFNGSSDYIDTGLKPRLEIRAPYTIMADFTPDTQIFADGSNILADLYAVGNVGSGAEAHYVDILNNNYYRIFGGAKSVQNITFTSGQRTKIVVKKDASKNLTYYVKVSGSETITGTLSSTTGEKITTNLFIGAALKSNAMSRFFKGTIHDIKVHLAEVSDEDISAYLS